MNSILTKADLNYDDYLKGVLQVKLNKLVRTEEFRKYVMQYVDCIPNDFNISLDLNEEGEIEKLSFGIIHYGYENLNNRGLSIYDDLGDFWTSPNDPEISEELKTAATNYLVSLGVLGIIDIFGW